MPAGICRQDGGGPHLWYYIRHLNWDLAEGFRTCPPGTHRRLAATRGTGPHDAGRAPPRARYVFHEDAPGHVAQVFLQRPHVIGRRWLARTEGARRRRDLRPCPRRRWGVALGWRTYCTLRWISTAASRRAPLAAHDVRGRVVPW